MNSEMMAKLRGLIEEAATGTCNMTAEGKQCPVHENEQCPGYVEEDIKPAGISDELAAKKIAVKIAGTPGLNIPKIKQYVTKYLSMVGKAPTDVDHLAALVSTELENKGVMESKSKPDFLDIDKDGNKKESMKDAAKDAKAGKKSTVKKGEMSAKQAKYFGKKTAVKESAELDALMKKYGVEESDITDAAQPMNLAKTSKRSSYSPELLALMQKYGVADGTDSTNVDSSMEEDMHITVDGAEAQDMINRLMSLAGQDVAMPADSHTALAPMSDDHADTCDGCGHADGECTCDQMTPASFGPNGLSMEENIDHDFGHTAHSDMGEPVDPDTYTYKAPVGTQRFVKGTMGDNPLIKENADALGAKLKKDYKRYVAEAELARSNAGDASPLTADNRDKFDKDPFTGDTPVTDGSRSPLSTVKRQKVSK